MINHYFQYSHTCRLPHTQQNFRFLSYDRTSFFGICDSSFLRKLTGASFNYFRRSNKVYSPFGIFAVLRYSQIALTNVFGSLKYAFTKSYDLTSCIFKSILQKSLGFFPDRLKRSYAHSLRMMSISISGAVITLMTSIL